MTALGPFPCKHAGLGIVPAIACLATRARCPNHDNCSKLVRAMKHLKKTRNDHLTLQSNGKRKARWCVDAAFVVHPVFKNHTGATMTCVEGAVMSTSCKQSMNARNSTKAEVMAANKVAGPMPWTNRFLECQQHSLNANILCQDN